ncbi:MAG: hypothetical protein JNK40_15780 [Chromatiales bacterium]|nr:hypothetical protein [Chromatiales bacterium]
MTRSRIGGTLNVTAMKALADSIEARPVRPVDRLDSLREARQLIAQGASIVDVAEALNVTTAVVRQLLGPGMRNKRISGTPETAQKGPELP